MTAPAPASEGPLSRRYLEITLAILALVTIVAFESMAVTTAMPAVARDLGAVRSYGLGFSVMLTAQLLGIVIAGVWSDRSGPLAGAFLGQVMLGIGSAMCGLAPTYSVFLLGRFLTGLGGGLLVVMLYVIAGRIYPEAIRPKLFTYISAAWVLPSLLGAPVSAWLTENASWRWVFGAVVFPVVATMIALDHARRNTDTTDLRTAVAARDHRSHVHAAWAGLGIAVSAGALQYGTHALEHPSAWTVALGVLGLLGVLLIAPRLLPRGTFVLAPGLPSDVLARAILAATFFAGTTFVPLYLVGQRGLSLQLAGLTLAGGSVGWAAGSWYQGHDRLHLPRHRLVELGGALLVASLAILAAIAWFTLPAAVSVIALVIGGFAMGIGVTSTTVLALELTPLEEHGEASSSIQLADVLGSTLGISAASAAFAAQHSPGQDARLFGGIFVALALVTLIVIPAGQRIRR